MTIRLEPPTLNITPNIVYEDEELIVVDKPPSFLVHAGAGSNFNTLQGVLIHILDQPANISCNISIIIKISYPIIYFFINSYPQTR